MPDTETKLVKVSYSGYLYVRVNARDNDTAIDAVIDAQDSDSTLIPEYGIDYGQLNAEVVNESMIDEITTVYTLDEDS